MFDAMITLCVFRDGVRGYSSRKGLREFGQTRSVSHVLLEHMKAFERFEKV